MDDASGERVTLPKRDDAPRSLDVDSSLTTPEVGGRVASSTPSSSPAIDVDDAAPSEAEAEACTRLRPRTAPATRATGFSSCDCLVFAAKVDVLFAESAAEMEVLRRELASGPEREDYRAALVRAVTAALRVAPEDREWALQRAQLVLSVPARQAQAAVVFARWRSIATDYVAGRFPGRDLFARAAGHAVLAATLAAHEHWIAHPDSELEEALRAVLDLLLPRELVEC